MAPNITHRGRSSGRRRLGAAHATSNQKRHEQKHNVGSLFELLTLVLVPIYLEGRYSVKCVKLSVFIDLF